MSRWRYWTNSTRINWHSKISQRVTDSQSQSSKHANISDITWICPYMREPDITTSSYDFHSDIKNPNIIESHNRHSDIMELLNILACECLIYLVIQSTFCAFTTMSAFQYDNNKLGDGCTNSANQIFHLQIGMLKSKKQCCLTITG